MADRRAHRRRRSAPHPVRPFACACTGRWPLLRGDHVAHPVRPLGSACGTPASLDSCRARSLASSTFERTRVARERRGSLGRTAAGSTPSVSTRAPTRTPTPGPATASSGAPHCRRPQVLADEAAPACNRVAACMRNRACGPFPTLLMRLLTRPTPPTGTPDYRAGTDRLFSRRCVRSHNNRADSAALGDRSAVRSHV